VSAPAQARRPGRYVGGRVDELREGERLIVDIDGRSVGVFNAGGRYYALLNRCPHQGGELCRGDLFRALASGRQPGEYAYVDGKYLIACPWHNWEFDLETGQSFFDPQRTRVRAYPVEVAPGAEVIADQTPTGRVRGPYTADTFPVEVEGEYLVVVIRREKRP
jgi:3-phenylpropionate/trans-cinnamate dioxygenase ferredoxin subunit